MTRPFCNINGKQYQLYMINDVLRFPDDGREMPDLNQMIVDYFKSKIPLSDLFEYYINSGSSYYLVEGIFSTNGINNHSVTQGKEKTKKFRLYK